MQNGNIILCLWSLYHQGGLKSQQSSWLVWQHCRSQCCVCCRVPAPGPGQSFFLFQNHTVPTWIVIFITIPSCLPRPPQTRDANLVSCGQTHISERSSACLSTPPHGRQVAYYSSNSTGNLKIDLRKVDSLTTWKPCFVEGETFYTFTSSEVFSLCIVLDGHFISEIAVFIPHGSMMSCLCNLKQEDLDISPSCKMKPGETSLLSLMWDSVPCDKNPVTTWCYLRRS